MRKLQKFALRLMLALSIISPFQAFAAAPPFQPNTVLTAAALNAALASPTITGGSITNVPITYSPISGGTGSFTTLSASSLFSGTTASLTGLDSRLFDGDQFIESADTSPFREGAWSSTPSGALYTLLGDYAMHYWSHNTALSSSGNFLGINDGGAAHLWAFSEAGFIKTFAAASSVAGTVPTFIQTTSVDLNTGNMTTAGNFTAASGVIATSAVAVTNGITAASVTASSETINGTLSASTVAVTGTLTAGSFSPSLATTASQVPQIGQVAQLLQLQATVSGNALTVTLPATTLWFKNGTINGAPIFVNTSAQSVVTPTSGATLGSVSAQSTRYAVVDLYNSGVPSLCMINLGGGTNLDETGTLASTTISGSATSATTCYATTGVGASTYRVVGYFDATEATAGTWATAPSNVQGIGGQAATALSGYMIGQSRQSLSFSSGTTYYNTTGKPIKILVSGYSSVTGSDMLVNVGGVSYYYSFPIVGVTNTAMFDVLINESYVITSAGAITVQHSEVIK